MSISEQIKTIKENVPMVHQAGYEMGYSSGHSDGYAQSEADFWSGFLSSDRTTFDYMFRYWGNEYIRPSQQIKWTQGESASTKRLTQMFSDCPNLKKIESAYFDLSGYSFISPTVVTNNAQGNYALFRYCTNLEEIEDIGLQSNSCYYWTFGNCSSLKTIEVIRVTEMTGFQTAFNNCKSLENIKIEGTIGQDGFDVSACTKLSKKSITSIINALSKNITATRKITLSLTAVNKAFETSTGANNGSTSQEWINLIEPKSNTYNGMWDISLS